MLFQVTGIKQVRDKQENISFLIEGETEAAIRDFCAKNSMAIFELKPFEGPKETFGKIKMRVAFAEAIYEMITPQEKAKDAYNFFTAAGLQIIYINNLLHPMSDEDVAMVLQKLKIEFAEEQKKIAPKAHTTSISNVVLEKDPELEKMKRISQQAITDMEEIKAKAASGFSLRKINDMKALEEELKKTRMGSNIPKMRSLVSDAYKLMEEIEMEYLDQQKAAEAILIENSVVTHLDLVREYEKYEKAQKVKRGKLEKTTSDMYYIFFGKAGMYQRFLTKDLEKRFTNRSEIVYKSIDYMITFVFMCLMWLTITSLYQHYVLQQEVFFFAFVDFALIGLILLLINKLKKRNVFQIIILLGIGVLLFFAIRYLIISNFAL